MSTATKIEWTDTTWNPVVGCTPVSEGCKHCYAATHARRLAGNPNEKVRGAYEGTARTAGDGRAAFTGLVRTLPERLEQPLRWRRPRRVFVNAMSDLFHPDVPDDFIDQVWAVMALTPQHTYQVLTKRPERMAYYLTDPELPVRVGLKGLGMCLENPGQDWGKGVVMSARPGEEGRLKEWPLPTVWVGTSVEHQEAADHRIPHLLRCPAAVRFLSCEPLLGPVQLLRVGSGPWYDPLNGWEYDTSGLVPITKGPGMVDWIIVGGESGPGARPCDVEWIRSLVRQGRDAGVATFVKQLGASWYEQLALMSPNDPKGGDPSEWPEDLRVREFPTTQEDTDG